MFKNKKAIIFDMDGTLIDSVGAWSEIDKILLKKLGCKEEFDIDFLHERRDRIVRQNTTKEMPYLEYCGFLKEEYNFPLSKEEIYKMRQEMAKNYLEENIDYKPNVEVFLKKLKEKNFTLAVATITEDKNFDIYRTKNKNIINKANIDDYFSVIYTKEKVHEIKPSPEIYLKIMQELNIKKEECIIFEDSLVGVEAAKASGAYCIVMYDKYSDFERNKINKLADYKFNNYLEAIKAFEDEYKE